MDGSDDLRAAFRAPARSSRRERRALRTRRRALSPVRILLRVAAIPLVAGALTVSIYIRTSPYPPPDALRHLMAMAGCDRAARLGLAPARVGELGYHKRNDPDGDGVACGSAFAPGVTSRVVAVPAETGEPARMNGGAKFLRP